MMKGACSAYLRTQGAEQIVDERPDLREEGTAWSQLQELGRKKEALRVGAGEGAHEPGGREGPGEGGKPRRVHKATRHVASLGLVRASAELTFSFFKQLLPERNEAEQNTDKAHENGSLELLAGRISAFQGSPGSKLGSKNRDFRISDCALHQQQCPSRIWLAPTSRVFWGSGYCTKSWYNRSRNFCLYSYR